MSLDQDILTVQQLADYLQLDQMTVYRMAKRGEIPSFRAGRKIRFERSDIEEWMQSRKAKRRQS